MKFISYMITLSFILSGCSENSSNKSKDSSITNTETNTTEQTRENSHKETYMAVLESIHPQLTGTISGALTFYKENDEFIADLRLTGAAPKIIHKQVVHTGRCPNLTFDENHDGFVDHVEAMKTLGPELIPLDSDLNGQLASYGVFPVGDEYGNYIYSAKASYQQFLNDLKAPDERASDDLIKLNVNEDLKLEGKVIVIRGVPEDSPLPPTVSSNGHLNVFQSLPIACGTLQKVNGTPGTYEEDPTLPLPVPSEGGETVGGSAGENDGTLGETHDEGGNVTGGDYGNDDTTPLP